MLALSIFIFPSSSCKIWILYICFIHKYENCQRRMDIMCVNKTSFQICFAKGKILELYRWKFFQCSFADRWHLFEKSEKTRGKLSIDAGSERERCDAKFWRIRELYKWSSSISRETFNLNSYRKYLKSYRKRRA